MDIFDPSTAVDLLRDLWNLPGAVGPIVTVAFATVFLVNLARKQLTEWIPWLATRRGALTLVGIFAAVGTAVSAALQGETSLLQLAVQALAAALTAVGMRSSTKAAIDGGSPTSLPKTFGRLPLLRFDEAIKMAEAEGERVVVLNIYLTPDDPRVGSGPHKYRDAWVFVYASEEVVSGTVVATTATGKEFEVRA